MQVHGQVDAALVPYRAHVLGQHGGVSAEPLGLRRAEVRLDLGRQEAAKLPPHGAEAAHPVVVVRQQAPRVSLHRRMSGANRGYVGDRGRGETIVVRSTKILFSDLRLV